MTTPQATPAQFLARHWSPGPHSLNVGNGATFRTVGLLENPDDLLSEAGDLDGNVWWGVNATPGAEKRGEAKDVVECLTLYIDLDWDDPAHKSDDLPTEDQVRTAVAEFPIVPTAVIDTGGGLHCYWRLARTVDPDTFERLQALVSAAFQERDLHPEATDLARILRVPGTLNHKYDPPRPIFVTAWRPRFAPSMLPRPESFESQFGHLVAPPEPKVEIVPGSLDDKFRQATTKSGAISDYRSGHTVADELRSSGWTLNPDGEWWTRPNRGEDGQSAKVHVDDLTGSEVAMIYSESTDLKVIRSIGQPCANPKIVMASAFDLYVEREHDGDVGAALRFLTPETDTQPPLRVLPNLPDEFWDARPVFDHVRRAAWSRMISPDALLGVVLSRFAAMIPPDYQIPPIVGTAATFDQLTVIVAHSSGGKSSALGVGAELIPATDDTTIVWDAPIGSGEGLIDALFEEQKETENGKTKVVKKRTKRAVHFIADEAKGFVETQVRQGSTAASVICSAWSGQTLGQTNASKETHRVVPARGARFSGVMGVQTTLGHILMSDALVEQGLTGRLTFFSATDPKMPHPDEGPEFPGPLNLTVPGRPFDVSALGSAGAALEQPPLMLVFPDEVVDEIRLARFKVSRGEVIEPPVEGHARLTRLKYAGIFSLMDGRRKPTVEDWDLAGVLLSVTAEIRNMMWEDSAETAARAADKLGRTDGRRAVAREEYVLNAESEKVRDTAQWIVTKIEDSGEESLTRLALKRSGSPVRRKHLDEAIDLGESLGWLRTWEVETRSKSISLRVAKA